MDKRTTMLFTGCFKAVVSRHREAFKYRELRASNKAGNNENFKTFKDFFLSFYFTEIRNVHV